MEDKKKVSSVRPTIGDIFITQKIEGHYYVGRVIKEFKEKGNFLYKMFLIYIYKENITDKRDKDFYLNKENLLIPPLITGEAVWKYGFLETIEHKDLQEEDILKQHCFYFAARNTYVDENGKQIAPQKQFGSLSIITGIGINQKIRDAITGD